MTATAACAATDVDGPLSAGGEASCWDENDEDDDEKFLQEVIPAPEFGGAFIHPGAERRVSIEVGYKF